MNLVEHTEGVDLDVHFRFRSNGYAEFLVGPAPVPCLACLRQMPGFFMYCGGSRYGQLADVQCRHCAATTRISDNDGDRSQLHFTLVSGRGGERLTESRFGPTLSLNLCQEYLLLPPAFRAALRRTKHRLLATMPTETAVSLSTLVAELGPAPGTPASPPSTTPLLARVPPAVAAWRAFVHSCADGHTP